MNNRSTIQQRNARTVIQTWRRGDHIQHWRPAAHNKTPAQLFTDAALAFQTVRETADHAADRLVELGFVNSHSEVAELRKIASLAAQRSTRHFQWAAELAEANLLTDNEIAATWDR
jgi:hypothetical protein